MKSNVDTTEDNQMEQQDGGDKERELEKGKESGPERFILFNTPISKGLSVKFPKGLSRKSQNPPGISHRGGGCPKKGEPPRATMTPI